MKKYLTLLKESIKKSHDDNVIQMAGGLSFFALLSLVPILVLALALIGLFMGEEEAHAEIIRQTSVLFNDQVSKAIKILLLGSQQPGAGVASLMSFLLLIHIASRVFHQIQDALKKIWKVSKDSSHFVKRYLVNRLASFLMLLVAGVFLFLSFIYEIGIQFLSASVHEWIPEIGKLELWRVLSPIASIPIVTILCAMVYRFVPRMSIVWSDLWGGAFLASILLFLGRYLLGYYFRWSNLISLYGAAGSIIVILLWIYYSSQIFLWGAEFTYVYAHSYGSKRKT